MSQNEQIIAYLKTGKSLTALEALNKFNCLRLAGRIFELRCKGHVIHSTIVEIKGKKIGKYWLGSRREHRQAAANSIKDAVNSRMELFVKNIEANNALLQKVKALRSDKK